MAKKNGKETTGGATGDGPQQPYLIPQPHGGALKSGGTPGNKGGGLHPHSVRHRLAASAMEAHDAIAAILARREPCEACGMVVTVSEATAIFDKFAKYGIGTKQGMDPRLMHALAEAVQVELEATDDQMRNLFGRWLRIIGTHVAGDD